MFDFKAIQAALTTSFDHEVVNPFTKAPSGWFVELATAAHGAAQSRVRGILDQMGKRKTSSLTQDEKDGVELIAARIVGWHGLEDDGMEVVYTPEVAVLTLTGAGAFWLRQQLIDAMGDTDRPFTPKTPGTS